MDLNELFYSPSLPHRGGRVPGMHEIGQTNPLFWEPSSLQIPVDFVVCEEQCSTARYDRHNKCDCPIKKWRSGRRVNGQ